MPRRRSDGLTDLSFGTSAAGVAAATLVVAAAAIAGCQAGTADTGCQIGRQIVLPGTTPLPLWPEVRIDRLDGGFVLLGSDTTAVRWTAIDMMGTTAAEQVVALPPGAL